MTSSSKDSLVLLLFYRRSLLFKFPDDEGAIPSQLGDATKVVPFLSQRTLDAFTIEPASGLGHTFSSRASSSSSMSFTSTTSSITCSQPSSLLSSARSSSVISVEPVSTPCVAQPPSRADMPIRQPEKMLLNPAMARRQRQTAKKKDEPDAPEPHPLLSESTSASVASPTSIGSPTGNSASAWLAGKKRMSLGFPDSSLGYVVSAGFEGRTSTDCLTLCIGGEQLFVLPVKMGDTDSDARSKDTLRLVAAVRSKGMAGGIVSFLRCVVRAMEREEEVCGFLSKQVALLEEVHRSLNESKSALIPPEPSEGLYAYVARVSDSTLCKELCAVSAAVTKSHEEGNLGVVANVVVNKVLKVPTRLLYDEKSLTPDERTALLRHKHSPVLASVWEGCPGEWHLVVQVGYEELLGRLAPLYDTLMGATGVATLPLVKVAVVTVAGLGPPPHSVHQLRTQLRSSITTDGVQGVLIDASDREYFVAQVMELLVTLDCIAILRPEVQLTVASLCPPSLINKECLQKGREISKSLRGCTGSCVLGDHCIVCQFLVHSELGRGEMAIDSSPPPLQYTRLFVQLYHSAGRWYDSPRHTPNRIWNVFLAAAKREAVKMEDAEHLRRFRVTARLYFPVMSQRVAGCFLPQQSSGEGFQIEKCVPYSFALEVATMAVCMILWDGASCPLFLLVLQVQAVLGIVRKAIKRLDRLMSVVFTKAIEDMDLMMGKEVVREVIRGMGLAPLTVRSEAVKSKVVVIEHLLMSGECGDWRSAIRNRLLTMNDMDELRQHLPETRLEDSSEGTAALHFVCIGLGIPLDRLCQFVKCRVFPIADLYPPSAGMTRRDSEEPSAASGGSDPRGYTLLLVHHALNLFSDAAFVAYHSASRSWV